jgi:hypothetical protein
LKFVKNSSRTRVCGLECRSHRNLSEAVEKLNAGKKRSFARKGEALGRLAGKRPVIRTNQALPKTLERYL